MTISVAIVISIATATHGWRTCRARSEFTDFGNLGSSCVSTYLWHYVATDITAEELLQDGVELKRFYKTVVVRCLRN